MPEKIKIENGVDPVEWALIAAITPKPAGDAVVAAHVPGEPIEVELRVCGVEVKFSTIIKRLMEQFDRMMHEKAIELLQERASGIEAASARAKKVIDEAVATLAKDLGVPLPED